MVLKIFIKINETKFLKKSIFTADEKIHKINNK
jgi:hypothetical protein